MRSWKDLTPEELAVIAIHNEYCYALREAQDAANVYAAWRMRGISYPGYVKDVCVSLRKAYGFHKQLHAHDPERYHHWAKHSHEVIQLIQAN